MSDNEPPAKRARSEPATEANVPVTLLSGFLGAGKTSLLKHILENKAGLKVGVIVNDVAEVNIDKALISTKASGGGGTSLNEDTIELQNGCACCSVAEEFLQSIEKLMQLARARGGRWDHIVVESSGVAEPREIRDNFRNALDSQPELLVGTELHTLVTVVDGSTFLKEFEKRNKVNQRTDLGTDDLSNANTRQVVDLMCEQIECSDVLLINKMDLISAAELTLLKETLKSLNPLALVHVSERGRVDLSCTRVLAAAKDGGVARMDEDSEHRRMVKQVKQSEGHEHGHASKHEHGHDAPSHEHGHQQPAADAHEHGHAATPAAAEKHEHGHGAPKAEGCDDTCTAEGHQNGHEHGHGGQGHAPGREQTRFGITSFCYQRRRPFHPHRLMSVIRQLPVRQERLALSEALTKEVQLPAGSAAPSADAAAERSPMTALIRSKGFLWLSNSHSQIFYWALAGKHFELTQYATWWQCLARSEWPTNDKEVADITSDFAGEFGDHRQEIVLIGVNMNRAAITALLDNCLLTDKELDAYRKHWNTSEDQQL